jgi:16S rRNA (uracil1498-N3)-methyltransferase
VGHVPHVYVPPPWSRAALPLDDDALHHVGRVLRRDDGSDVTYTDGCGVFGEGHLSDGAVVRGAERRVEPPPDITLAVATLRSVDRMRFVVEKLAELGVARLVWLATAHASGRSPKPERCRRWAVAALQQSRGAHLLSIEGPVTWSDLDDGGALLVADQGGDAGWGAAAPGSVVVIGPEGGFAPGEVPPRGLKVGLGPTVLRTETAAVVAASHALERTREAGRR